MTHETTPESLLRTASTEVARAVVDCAALMRARVRVPEQMLPQPTPVAQPTVCAALADVAARSGAVAHRAGPAEDAALDYSTFTPDPWGTAGFVLALQDYRCGEDVDWQWPVAAYAAIAWLAACPAAGDSDTVLAALDRRLRELFPAGVPTLPDDR